MVEQTAASSQLLPTVSVEMLLALAFLEIEFSGQVLNGFWMNIFVFAVFPLTFPGRSLVVQYQCIQTIMQESVFILSFLLHSLSSKSWICFAVTVPQQRILSVREPVLLKKCALLNNWMGWVMNRKKLRITNTDLLLLEAISLWP